MRKAIILIGLLAVTVLLASSTAFAAESQWFDMQNCEMCKPLMQHEGLLEHMTWEQYNLPNGIISVTTVDKEFMKPFKEAQAKMQQVSGRLAKGEKVKLCPSCTAMGQIMAKGLKMQHIDTMRGSIMILTSDKPELVKEIQDWAKRTNDEMMKMHSLEKKQQMKEMH